MFHLIHPIFYTTFGSECLHFPTSRLPLRTLDTMIKQSKFRGFECSVYKRKEFSEGYAEEKALVPLG